jgi:hypothetical protein
MLNSLLKQPLLHFVLLGGLLFLAYDFRAVPSAEEDGAAASDLIVVDRATLLDFMQYQAQAFEPELFSARLDAMSPDEVLGLVDAYVREEALYREALQMDMDRGDYIIRQRLVQKVEFLLENLATENSDPTDAELQAFYEARIADYEVGAVYTFTHIFFDGQDGAMEEARMRAEATLARSDAITFEQSSQYGDRYPFLQNYVERTRDFVVNNFSAGFVAALDALPPGDERWQGPLASRYGYHLVLLRARAEPFTPPLQDVRARVLDDFRYENLVRKRQEAEDRVVAEYEVSLRLE